MSPKRRSVSLTICTAVAAALVPLAIAWACTPKAIVTLSTSQGSPGRAITVTGQEFLARPVEISIGDQAVTTVTGPTFTTTVTIPELRPGLYFVRAVVREADGSIAGQPVQPLEVVAPAATGPAVADAAPSRPENAPTPSAGSDASGSASSSAALVGAPVRKDAAETKTGASRDSSAPARRAARNRPARGQAAAPSTGRRSPSMQAPAVRTESGRTVFAGSVASPAGREAVSAGRDRPTERGRRQRGAPPSPAAERPRSPTGASLLPSVTDPDMRPGQPSAALAIGAGMLGLGMVAVLAGFLVAEVRRRRAPAGVAR